MKGRRLPAVAAAALVAVACYVNALGNGFVFDDVEAVTRNPLVTSDHLRLTEIFTTHYWAHLTPTGNLYRPLVILSYALNHAVAGLDPWSYHLVNILLHALCAALVVGLALRLGLSPGGSLAAGLLFAAHPVHTEAVVGVVGRADLMAAAAVLGAWVVHLAPRRSGVARPIGIGLLFAIGLLSKENAVVLPALMVAGDIYRVRRGTARWREALPALVVCAGTAAGWLALRAWLLPAVAPGSISESLFAGAPFMVRFSTALSVLLRYLGLLFFPVTLSADYSFEQIPALTGLMAPMAVAGILIYTAIGVAGLVRLAAGRTAHLDGLCAAFFLVAMAPVSNIFLPIGTMMGERLLYLPSVAFCLLPPVLWTRTAGRWTSSEKAKRLAAALTALVVIPYAMRTVSRNADWKDQLTLFGVTVSTSPRSAKAHYNYGVALEEAGRPEEALGQYLAALAIREDDAKSQYNAGLLLARMGRSAEALEHVQRAARLDPDLPGVHNTLGAICSDLGRTADAEAAFRETMRRDPLPADRHAALYNLGTLMLATGRADRSIEPLEQARAIDPDDPDSRYQLGLAYLRTGRPVEAAGQLEKALELAPTMNDALVPLARAYHESGDDAAATATARRAAEAGLELPADLRELISAGPHGRP